MNDISSKPTIFGFEVTKLRNYVAFWMLGLCNNYSYVIMLSAAYDILETKPHVNSNTNGTNGTLFNFTTQSPSHEEGYECHPTSTGIILVADVLPSLLIKLSAPFYMKSIPYDLRVGFCVLTAIASFIIVALSDALWISLLGVVLASISSGLGEISFLSLTSFYHKNTISLWSSGTGFAGIAGSVSYALFTKVLSPRNTLFLITFVPILEALSYWFVLIKKKSQPPVKPLSAEEESDITEDIFSPTDNDKELLLPKEPVPENDEVQPAASLSLVQKFWLIKPLFFRYMLPLSVVYYSEYMINQGLFELTYFKNAESWISIQEQYRWYQVLYQVGVFLSRSSVNLFKIKMLWILALLQVLNLAFFLAEAILHFLPSIWIMFAIILYEGFLGGLIYVNAFYKISEEVEPKHREFSLGVASVGDSFGITLAGITAQPIHNWICNTYF